MEREHGLIMRIFLFEEGTASLKDVIASREDIFNYIIGMGVGE